jgi:hypothetical protein
MLTIDTMPFLTNETIKFWNMSFIYLDKMISRFIFKSTSIICRSCQQQQRRIISTLLSTSSVQTSFYSLRFLSKSAKSNKKYQVCHEMI